MFLCLISSQLSFLLNLCFGSGAGLIVLMIIRATNFINETRLLCNAFNKISNRYTHVNKSYIFIIK